MIASRPLRLASILLLAAVMAGAPFGAPAAARGNTVPMALWIWERPTAAALEVVVVEGFNAVYLHVPPGSASAPAYLSFVASAHDRSIEVYALGGVPGWSHEHDRCRSWIEEVAGAGIYDGIVLDVEPYLLPDWNDPKRRAGLLADYLILLDTASAAAGHLPVVSTVPFWWDDARYRVQRGLLFVEEVLLRSDAIAVMAYRDQIGSKDGIHALVADEIDLAEHRDKSAVIILETQPNVAPKLTFYEEGRAALESVMVSLADHWRPGRGFGGLAIHSYRSYVALPP